MPSESSPPLPEPLRVLILEDNPDDADLLLWHLRRSGFEPEWERVERLEEFAARLNPNWDVILADYRLPGFDAPTALQLVRRAGLEVPFIVVSGTIGEEQAVECMRHGAVDYLFKDRLARLGEAIRQAIEDRRLRDDKRRAEEASRESEERARLALEAGRMGVVQIDLESNTVSLDSNTRELFGLGPGDNAVPVATILGRIHPDDRARVRDEIMHTLQADGTFEIEFRAIASDGSDCWLVTRGRVLRDAEGCPLRVLAVIVEISQRKRAEQELARARDAAEAASRAKDEFLAALSHELRTPLNPVLLLASEKETSLAVPEELRADFGLIRQNVELEARLIDDLLDLSRIVAGRLLLSEETLDVHEVLRQSIQIVQGDVEKKRLRLAIHLNAAKHMARGDPVRLQQVFWNLLKNAVKFTPNGGAIEVCSRNDAAMRALQIEFRDTGIGMTEEELQSAFQTFAKGTHGGASDPRHRFGGLGVGLTICKALVEMHHGRITAASAGRGRGAVFTVELPLTSIKTVAPSDQAPPPLEGEPAAARGLAILLVEDHRPTRLTLARILARRSHRITEADTVSAARQAVEQGKFDLILSDIGLPDGTGYDLLTELRARGDTTPAVALSGFGMEADVKRSLECGFSAHLTKPVEIQTLEREIAATMVRERSARENVQ